MKKVLYITNLPAPYRTEFFVELGKKIQLTVVFERKCASDRNDKWVPSDFNGFEIIYLKGKLVGSGMSFCSEICKVIRAEKYDEIVVGAYYSPTEMIAIQYMKAHKIPYYISVDGGFIKQDNLLKYSIKNS